MTLLSVVKDVCAVVGVMVPQSVFSNITGNRTMQEMLALANEAAQRIAYDSRDWAGLKTTAKIVGDGVADRFNLPANYKRMLLTSNVWLSTASQTPMTFIPDADTWLQRRLNAATAGTWGEWTIIGRQIYIFPVMGMGVTASFAYLDKNCIDLANGGHGDKFMDDNDTFALDERVLKLGMTWQWKAQKGSAYAEDIGTYGDALTYAMGKDSPSPIIMDKPAYAKDRWGGWDGRIQ